ncbi:ABC transporter permease [Solibacillus sp. FSL K6-1523]|uniref:ABC transporter permease n=1 Tax=Solibacillus sp. FSL K6-1523 TaxID=2921471 RepID=UPI0030FC43E4
MDFLKKYSVTVGFLISLLLIVEIAVRLLDLPTWLFPAPSIVIIELFQTSGELLPHVMATVKLTFIGLIAGSVLGFIVGILLHLLPIVHKIGYPLILISQNIPTLVLAPLLIIWFGFGLMPKVVIIGLVCFFPIAIALLDGLRQTTPELRQYFQMAGATKWQQFWKLELPFAMPALFSGLKIAATYSVMGAVITEWLGAKQGIGVYMTLAQSAFRTDRVFVAITLIVILSLCIFGIIRLIEERVVHNYKKEGPQHANHSSTS